MYIKLISNLFCRNFDRIAAATSSRTVPVEVHLFDLSNSKGLAQIQRYNANTLESKNNSSICGIRFANENSTTLFVAEASGNIYTYDIRTKPAPVQTFHNADIDPVVFSCFDVNVNDKILCAGTERSTSDAYVVLFDVRECSTLATYTDSHRDDLTQVKFHPNKSNKLASGSTDGLINVFNVNEPDEYDALEYCLNTESSVQTLNWHPNQNKMQMNDDSDDNDDGDTSDLLSCITDTNDFQLFNVNESELLFQAKRSEITASIKRKVESDCYLVSCHNHQPNGDEIFVLAGSNFGSGNCLRSLIVDDKSFKPGNNFIGNKQIVRCSLFNSKVTSNCNKRQNIFSLAQSASIDYSLFILRTTF